MRISSKIYQIPNDQVCREEQYLEHAAELLHTFRN